MVSLRRPPISSPCHPNPLDKILLVVLFLPGVWRKSFSCKAFEIFFSGKIQDQLKGREAVQFLLL